MDHRFTLTAALALILAGCGSDTDCSIASCPDGSGGGIGGGVGGTGLATLDENNTLAAIREAWFAAATTAELPGFVVATGIGDTSGGVATAIDAAAKTGFRNRVSLAPFGPTVYNCPVSGQFTASGDVEDPNTVTAGDTTTYESTSCDSGTGYTVDGSITIAINSIDGDPNSSSYLQDQTMTFTDWTAATATLTTNLAGDHTAAIDTRNAAEFYTIFAGNSLVIVEQGITLSVGSYSGLLTDLPASNSLLLDADGNANSSLIIGSVNYGMLETFVQTVGGSPTDGIFEIFGLNGGTARFAIVTDTIVRVQLDANASGNYEISTDMTWDEFLAGSVPLISANTVYTPDEPE
ncbi:MAG: hypothetical protein QNJ00_11450 [Woeseiaceae bacterium]|nr:hypothetical protein [Woeseiaceae bacterium]